MNNNDNNDNEIFLELYFSSLLQVINGKFVYTILSMRNENCK